MTTKDEINARFSRVSEVVTRQRIDALRASVEAVTPLGWENVVKSLKKSGTVDNPWALAWWMENQGYKPRAAADENAGTDFAAWLQKYFERALR